MKIYLAILLTCLVCEGAFDAVTIKDARQKRYELDFPTCLENFDIHADTIIRAQDSRALGGRYINESEVSSREECLKLCCQTSLCDVFIFEEKTPGSCYLFDCGSSDDFKCKFNPHHHYTSGVMAVNRHVAELESQVKLSKHEQELTGLRKSLVAEVAPQSTIVTLPITSTTPPSTGGVLLVTTAVTARAATRHCTRYQFECRSTGECIAIYNACDGIPQCSDGSDEGPELACPSAASVTTAPPPPPPLPHPTHLSVGQPERPLNPQAVNWQYQSQYPAAPAPQYPAQFPTIPQQKTILQSQLLPQLQQPMHPQLQRPVAPPLQQQTLPQDTRKFYGRNEDAGAVQWPQQPPPNVPSPQQTFRRPYPSEYEDNQNSHIFNHKGSGLISSDSDNSMGYGEYGTGDAKPSYYNGARFPQPQQQWPRIPQPDHELAHSMEEELRGSGAAEQRQRFGSPPVQGPEHAQNDYYYEEGGAQQRGSFHHHVHPPPPDHIASVEEKPQPIAVMPLMPVTEIAHPTTKLMVETTTEHPLETAHANGHWTGEPSKKKALPHHAPPPLDPEPLKDGAARRPGGAYLSLSIGLAVTALLLVLISCRFRVVRRKLRRGGGKSPYAHDADFLVNGMYL